MTLGKCFPFSVSQFPHLQNERLRTLSLIQKTLRGPKGAMGWGKKANQVISASPHFFSFSLLVPAHPCLYISSPIGSLSSVGTSISLTPMALPLPLPTLNPLGLLPFLWHLLDARLLPILIASNEPPAPHFSIQGLLKYYTNMSQASMSQ